MPRVYRAAVVGCGRIGIAMERDDRRAKPATHAGAFALSPFTELCAFVDAGLKQLENARMIFPEVPVYTDIEKMLKENSPDIVAVATPPDQHRPVVELCAKYRVPAILCEKPIADSQEDGEAIVRACRESGSLLFINHMRRFSPLMKQAAQKLRKGDIGPLYHGNCYYTAGLFNTGTHLVDLLRFLTGSEAEWVSAFVEPRFTAPRGDLNVNATIMWEGGLVTSFQALEVKDYAILDAHLYGSRGALLVRRFGFSADWIPVVDCGVFEGYKELGILQSAHETDPQSLFAPVVEHIVACLEGNAKPASSGEDGLQALRILHALQESASKEGQRIYLPAKKEAACNG